MGTKHFITSICLLLLCAMAATAQKNTLSIPDVSVGQGRTIALPINMDNTTDVVAVQFTLTMPDGVTLEPSTATLSERSDGHSVTMKAMGQNKYMAMIFSPSNKAIIGSSGKLMSVNICPSTQVKDGSVLPLQLSDVVIADNEGSNLVTGYSAGKLTIAKATDFEVSSVSATPTTLAPGASVSVKWQVANVGGVSSKAGWNESIYLDAENGTSKLLGTVYNEGILAAGGTVSRSADFLLPQALGLDGKASVRVKLTANSDAGESTGSQENNTAQTDAIYNVGKLLTLTPTTANVDENAGGSTRFQLTRSGSTASAETFTLTATADSRVTLPKSVTIEKGQSGVYFYAQVTANKKLDNDSIVSITITGNGYSEAKAKIALEDDTYPSLTLKANAEDVTEGGSLVLTVTTERAPSSDMEIKLTCDHASRFTIPTQITLPAGKTSVDVTVATVEDDIPSAEEVVTFTASAPGHNPATLNTVILDDDVPTLTLQLTPNAVSEGDGPLSVSARLCRTDNKDKTVTVKFTDDSNGGIYYGQQTVTMASGVEEVTVNLGPIDNATVDGERTYNISAAVWIASCSCNASNGTSGGTVTVPLTVYDNDGPTLTLSSSASVLKEGGEMSVTISRNTSTTNALTVALTSDHDAQIEYPTTVTIPAGETSASFTVKSNGNDVSGDGFTATITASADGYAKSTTYFSVTDQTLPDAQITAIGLSETEKEVGATVTVKLTVANTGAYELPELTNVGVYVGGTLNTTIYLQSALAAGETTELSKEITLPTSVGTYNVYAVVNESHDAKELLYTNNTSSMLQVKTVSPFSVTVAVDKATYLPNEIVHISGVLKGNDIAYKDVEIYIIKDIRQTITATTDENGKFSAEWTPYSLQAGRFSIGACYPGEGSETRMAAIDIYGLSTNGESNGIEPSVGDTYQGTINIQNIGSLKLTGITANITSKPDNCTVNIVSAPSEIEGGNSLPLVFNIIGNEPSEGNQYSKIVIDITTNEGVSASKSLLYYCHSQKAILKSDVTTIQANMTVGTTIVYPIKIANYGKTSTGKISVSLPGLSWMSLATPKEMSALDFGEVTTIQLLLSPQANMELNIPISGIIGINCENGDGISIPFKLQPVSESTGTLNVDVCDEYTYYTEEAPHVKNAKVVIEHPTTGEAIIEGTTDENGVFTCELPAGNYGVTVTESNHDTYTNAIYVSPGKENDLIVNINFKSITYSWDVVETTVEDKYEIVTNVEYETRVPAPVIVVDFPKEIPYEDHVFVIPVTNKGLISAYNVGVTLPQEDEYMKFEVLDDKYPIAELCPQQSVLIPIQVTVKKQEEIANDLYIVNGGELGDSSEEETSEVSDSKEVRKARNLPAGCFSKTITVYRDKYKCNKQTGKPEPDGLEAVQATYYYGNCGGRGTSRGDGSPSLPYIPSVGGGGTSGPSGRPSGPSLTNDKGKAIEDTRLYNWLMYGCTTNCEDKLAAALKDCAKAAAGCTGLTDGWELIMCPFDLYDGCHEGLESFENKFDCGSAAYGCVPKLPLQCPLGIVSCIKSAYHAFYECIIANKKKKGVKSYLGITDEMTQRQAELFAWADLYEKFNTKQLEILGDKAWLNLKGEEIMRVNNYIKSHIENHRLVLSSDWLDYKPDAISKEIYEKYLHRISNTLDLEQGIAISSDNYVNKDSLQAFDDAMAEMRTQITDWGYSDYEEYGNSVNGYYQELLDKNLESSNSVCSSITLQFSQQMVMTRQAFRGTLTVYNGNETTAMTDVKLTLTVADEDGNLATSHEFQINPETLKGFTGELSFTDGWTLAAGETGTATVLFIPTKYAAPTENKAYLFGGSLSYVDPYTGLEVTRTLSPVTLTVKPSPNLNLTYFMQRDIIGDDPLTEAIEPCEEAEFSLLINNVGYGDATDVRMTTDQPKIIDNEKGLKIDFELMSSQLNGGDKTLALGGSVATEFGTIPAHGTSYAQWWLKSSLLGHFTDYDVKATHVTSYGNEDLSLLGDVTIHELIRSLDASDGDKQMVGFMTNDIVDADDTPDMLYLSDGTTQSVAVAAASSIVKVSATEYELTVTPTVTGWNYGNLKDPTYGVAALKSIVRKSDGKEVSLRNIWQTDRTLRDGKDPLYENRLHFADDFSSLSPVTYTLTFEPTPELLLEVAAFEGVPAEGTLLLQPIDTIKVVFNKPVDATTFTADDITMCIQGEKQDAEPIGITTNDNKTFTLDFTKFNETSGNGYHTLTVQTAGITDYEGYQGKNGKQTAWIMFRDGYVKLLTSAYPKNSGTVKRSTSSAGKTRKAETAGDTDTKAEYGSTVFLTAVPNHGYEFSNWTLNGEEVSTDATYECSALSDMDVVANFNKKSYNVTLVAGEGGQVTGNATGIYTFGEQLSFTAKADEDYVFGSWTVDGQPCGNADSLVIVVDSAMTVEATFVRDIFEQRLKVAEGWNWISSYLKEPLALDALTNRANRIVGQTGESVYDAERGFVGDIDSIEGGTAYKVEASSALLKSFKGHLYDTKAKPLSLKAGWNWIAYPYYENRELAKTITNADDGDFITAQTGFAEYAEGSWEGTFDTFVPGCGYLYKSMSNKSLVFDFSGATAGDTSVSQADDTSVDIHKYPNTMNVIAKLYMSDSELTGDTYTVYAMSGNEVRGAGTRINGKYYITVYGDDATDISFIVEDAANAGTYISKSTLTFNNDVVGNRKSPYTINLSSLTGIDGVFGDGAHPMRVYSLQGLLIKPSATVDDIKRLPKGVYIIDGSKYVVK